MTAGERSARACPILALVAGVVGIVGLAEVAPAEVVPAQQVGGCARTCAAQPDSTNPSPRYPEILRSSNVSGRVAFRVVIDTAGHVMHGEWRVLRSSHELFTQAVRTALPKWRYRPSQHGKRFVRDTLEYEVVFSRPDEPGFQPMPAVELSRAQTGPRRWRIEVGTPGRDPAASRLDSATVAAVSEAVLGALLERVADGPDRSTQPHVACIRWSTGGRVVDVSAAMLARLARPGVLVLAQRRCPPTFASMILVVDSTGRSALPPGEDPHRLEITRLRPWRDGIVLVDGSVERGTGATEYACVAQRAVADASVWQVACDVVRYMVSVAPSGRQEVASRAR